VLKITVFRDEEMAPPPVPASARTGIGMKTPARKVSPNMGGSGVTPFRDEFAMPVPTPNMVAFTPFRDEVWLNTFIIRTYFTDYNLVMKLKVGTSVVGVSQGMLAGKGVGLVGVVEREAEALRKDPLKNYVGLPKFEG
jgi:hypothetical protein